MEESRKKFTSECPKEEVAIEDARPKEQEQKTKVEVEVELYLAGGECGCVPRSLF